MFMDCDGEDYATPTRLCLVHCRIKILRIENEEKKNVKKHQSYSSMHSNTISNFVKLSYFIRSIIMYSVSLESCPTIKIFFVFKPYHRIFMDCYGEDCAIFQVMFGILLD